MGNSASLTQVQKTKLFALSINSPEKCYNEIFNAMIPLLSTAYTERATSIISNPEQFSKFMKNLDTIISKSESTSDNQLFNISYEYRIYDYLLFLQKIIGTWHTKSYLRKLMYDNLKTLLFQNLIEYLKTNLVDSETSSSLIDTVYIEYSSEKCDDILVQIGKLINSFIEKIQTFNIKDFNFDQRKQFGIFSNSLVRTLKDKYSTPMPTDAIKTPESFATRVLNNSRFNKHIASNI
jgi:hypothetical protein